MLATIKEMYQHTITGHSSMILTSKFFEAEDGEEHLVEVNKRLYQIDSTMNFFQVVYEDDNFLVTISDEKIMHVGRELRVTKVLNKETGKFFFQPWYRSTGNATPEKSPKGTWWPFSALFTTPAFIERYGEDTWVIPGWIGKHYFDPRKEVFVNHQKDSNKLPRTFQLVQGNLSRVESIPETKYLGFVGV